MKAAAFALVLAGASRAEPFDAPAEFDAFWTPFDECYALFEVKHVDWDAVRTVYGPMVTPEATRSELFDVFEAATDLLNDLHVTVEDTWTGRFVRSGGRSLGTDRFETGTFSIDVIAGH